MYEGDKMLIFSIVFGIIIGFLRRGSLYRLGEIKIKYSGLLFLSFGLKFVIYTQTQSPDAGWLLEYGALLHMLLYLPLFYVLWKNWELFAVPFLSVGIIANALVIFINQGQMPVSAQGLEQVELDFLYEILQKGGFATHSLIEAETRLAFLGDVIVFPPFLDLPISQLVSIGDILIFLGMVLFIQHAMVYQNK